jgi:hypothetical protein
VEEVVVRFDDGDSGGGGGEQELERVLGEVTDPTRKAETKVETKDVTGREM